MGFLSGRKARAEEGGPGWQAWDGRWYAPLDIPSDSGLMISAETTLRCGTVLAALRFKAESFAMCPPKVYRELKDRREQDRKHYLFRVLRKPNAWQTGFRWRSLQQVHMGLWGNAYSRILGGPRAFVEELRPMHPACVSVKEQRANGEMVYEYRAPGVATPETLGQDEVLHFRGLSTDGFGGVVTYQLMRNVVGIALAAEKHAAVFLRKGTRLSGVLTTKEPFPQDVQERAEQSWLKNFSGAENEGKVAMMGGGLEFKPITTDHRNAQFLELRDFQVQEILRFLGVPGVVVGYADKTATYASAKEFFESGGIKHCLLPAVFGMEEEIDYALLTEEDDHYCKFSLDILTRANTKERVEMLVRSTGRPFMTGNEARLIEDMNPIDDDDSMDHVLMPSNMAGSLEAEPDPAPPPPPPPPPQPAPALPDDDAEARATRAAEKGAVLVRLNAARVVRREVAAIADKAPKHASDPEAWRRWVDSYYERHAGHVVEALDLSPAQARAYCERQASALLEGGARVAEAWEHTVPQQLAAMALGG